MKNKQDKFILKAFMAAKTPCIFKDPGNHELLAIDEIMHGYCSRLLGSKSKVDILTDEIITKEDKNLISKLINASQGYEKNEMAIYYRLAILAEGVLYKYRKQ